MSRPRMQMRFLPLEKPDIEFIGKTEKLYFEYIDEEQTQSARQSVSLRSDKIASDLGKSFEHWHMSRHDS